MMLNNPPCPKCCVGEIIPFNGVLTCTYCNETYAPRTSRERFELWFDREMADLDKRLARRSPMPDAEYVGEWYEEPAEEVRH